MECPRRCDGCNGGLMQHVFAYARDHSVVVASDEPYVGYDTACRRHRARSCVDVKQFKVISIDNDPYLELRMATLIKRHRKTPYCNFTRKCIVTMFLLLYLFSPYALSYVLNLYRINSTRG